MNNKFLEVYCTHTLQDWGFSQYLIMLTKSSIVVCVWCVCVCVCVCACVCVCVRVCVCSCIDSVVVSLTHPVLHLYSKSLLTSLLSAVSECGA